MDLARSYVVPMSPGEVLARLSKAMDPDGPFAEWGSGPHPLYGTISGDWFELKLRSDIQNSFKLVLEGKVTARPEGSLVRVRVRVNSVTPNFMKVWLAGTVGFQILFLLGSLAGEAHLQGWMVLAPSGMALFGLLLYRFGKLLSKPEGDRLLNAADRLWGPPLSEASPSERVPS
jgi:hypothetical protein